ncbi:MAG: hypothetical protein ACXABY_06525 [Candidatus Thorarchaeota archaeon]|jgi:hypothetical protein
MYSLWVVQTGEASEGSFIEGIFDNEQEALDLVAMLRQRREGRHPDAGMHYRNLETSTHNQHLNRVWWDSHRVDYISIKWYPLNERYHPYR